MGLNKLCKLYGIVKLQGVEWVWGYANDEAVKAEDMPVMSEAWKESERAKYLKFVSQSQTDTTF